MSRLLRLEGAEDNGNMLRRELRRLVSRGVGPRRSEGDCQPAGVVSAERVVSELTRERRGSEEPIYRLHNGIIQGDLNLKHRTIEVAVDIQNCEFKGEVDFSYCEFKQVVNLSGSTFCREFTSGRDLKAYTVYRKDLICNGTDFVMAASFAGARVEGDAHFSEKERNTRFRGKTDFSSFNCNGYGFFTGVQFESGSGVDFSYSTFGRSLKCEKAIFTGPADFWSLRCNDSAYFRQARFRSKETALNDYGVRFDRATFGEQLDCEGAEFEGPVSFYAMRCSGTASFSNARFLFVRAIGSDDERSSELKKPAAEFTASYFGKQLDCRGALFRGAVNFTAIECTGEGLFTKAVFQGDEHGFSFATVERNLRFNKCTFLGDTTDFRYARVGGNLSFQYVSCETNFRLGHANIKYKLRFGGSRFKEKVELYNTRIGILELLDNNHNGPISVRKDSSLGPLRILFDNNDALKEVCKKRKSEQGKKRWDETVEDLYPFMQQSLSLADINFERFHAGPIRQLVNALALKFAQGQDPGLFRRDPFLQLERFFQNQGNETEAKAMYREGRIAYRKNAKNESGNVDWSRSKWFADWLWKWFTGYGVGIYRLLVLAFAFLIFGTLMFYTPDLIVADASTHFPKGIGAFIAAHLPSHALDPATTSVVPEAWHKELPYRAAYSLDLFLPLVNLHIDEKWQPNGPVLQVYAMVHAVVGWLLVPLLVAALAGIMRR